MCAVCICIYQPSEAVEILLQTKKYERALKILEGITLLAFDSRFFFFKKEKGLLLDSFKLHPNGLEHYELFHLLFCDSLRRKDTQLCQRLFNFLPSKFGFYSSTSLNLSLSL